MSKQPRTTPAQHDSAKKPLIDFVRPGSWEGHFIVQALQEVRAAIPNLERDRNPYPFLNAVYFVQRDWEGCQTRKLKKVLQAFNRDYNPEDKNCLPGVILDFSGADIGQRDRATFVTVLAGASASDIPPEKFERYVRKRGGPSKIAQDEKKRKARKRGALNTGHKPGPKRESTNRTVPVPDP